MRILHPLRSAPVALLWGGLSLSAIGDQLYAVAIAWIAVAILGPAAGYLVAIQAAALLVCSLGIGAWADTRPARRSMIEADLARAAILALLVAWWLAEGTLGAGPLILAVIVLAAGQAVFQPALQAVLPPLVPDPALLPAANGLLDATDRTARLIGPGAIALMAGAIPPVHFLSLDAASFLASAAALALIGRRAAPTPRPTRPEARIRDRLLAGRRAMASHAVLRLVLATTGLVNGAWYAAFYLGLPLIIEHNHVQGPGGTGLGAFGLVISAYGCTNLLATLIVGSRPVPARPQFQMFGGTLIVGAGIMLMGLASLLPHPWILPGLAAAAGLSATGGPMKDIPLAVLRQSRLAPPDVPPAMRAYMVANSAGLLVAMLVAPTAYALGGNLPMTVLCGAILAAVGLAGLIRLASWAEPTARPA